MEESLRTTAVHYDGRHVWAVDDIVGGLYKIDMLTMDVLCVIDPIELYRYDSFEVASIIEKDNFIIIIPQFLKHRWVFYNKKNKEILYRKILSINGYTPEIRLIKNTVYIPPLFSNGVFVLLDINQMQPISIIEKSYMKDQEFQIWRTFQVGNTCCLPLRGTKMIYGISGDFQRFIEMEIEEMLGDADGENGEYWVLPLKGNCIYHVDDKGAIIKKIRLIIDTEELQAGDFIRIISTHLYIFLLPNSKRDICVYDRMKCQFFKIHSKESQLSNKISYDIDDLPYWGYLMNKESIWFLPRSFKLMSIKFDTLEIENRDIFLPSREDYEIVNKWVRMSHTDNIFFEEAKDSLFLYLKNNRIGNVFQNQEVGKKIYKYIATHFG